MKYAQLVMGLLVGTALGGTVIAATGKDLGAQPVAGATAGLDKDAIKALVRETIMEEPQLILESVQKFQQDQRVKDTQGASDALKDPALLKAVMEPKIAASFGPKNSKKVIVEFFDYNCPVCKMQHKILKDLMSKDKELRLVLREYPIFGPSSDFNSAIGLAIHLNHPEKYQAYFEQMLEQPGHGDEKAMLKIVKDLGLDIEKLKEQAKAPEVEATMKENREIGEKLHIQGTPTLIVNGQIIPHAAPADELEARLKAK